MCLSSLVLVGVLVGLPAPFELVLVGPTKQGSMGLFIVKIFYQVTVFLTIPVHLISVSTCLKVI